VVVEFVGRDSGSYSVNWLELSRRRHLGLSGGAALPSVGQAEGAATLWDCPHRCPELDACINQSLWCDGRPHCPSGYDEAPAHCWLILRNPIMHFIFGELSKKFLWKRRFVNP